MSQGGVTAGTNPDLQRGILPAASDHRLAGRWLTTAASRCVPSKPKERTARANERPVRSARSSRVSRYPQTRRAHDRLKCGLSKLTCAVR
ncbi:T0031706 isoform 1 [Pongo abelii]|uniref:T0031706 isoform 1 n=1 Tax=Pongo abelii TaxID=9601 RepID=A0A2J8WLF6_PONAB|nr:T0031706 isoform 1 [Pongo abelii]